jgi:tyrosyl-tRNA synthetase
MLNNDKWLSELRYLDFLRDIGKHFSINRMLTFDTVKSRIEKNEPLSFLEFNYMILQGYDFYHLSKNYDCVLQMGGSDQWGNIINGMELTRRLTDKRVYGLTSLLLTNASGQKMGKSASGAVWLNSERLSPYEFWQFWRNCDDADVYRFLLLFTDIPIEQCAKLTAKKGEKLNAAKIELANKITELCHGRNETEKAFSTSKLVFGNKEGVNNLPYIELSHKVFKGETTILKILTQSDLAKSGKEARRLIKEKAVKIAGEQINDISLIFENSYFKEPKIVSIGKKKHYRVQIT